jgi:signal transduction histidine kinase
MLLDNSRLVEELRASRARIAESAQEERARLERDLHDGAQQRLMAIQIKLSLLRDAGDPGEHDALLDELDDDAMAAVEELRALAHGIYPPILRDRGLTDALRSAALRTPMEVSLHCQGTDRYPAATEAAVYFSVLEAMQNALKHSPAGAHLDLSLDCEEGGVSFAVADDGTGFDLELHGTGLGLISMRDRMAAVGGALTVSSRPGSGTTVSGRAPARQNGER